MTCTKPVGADLCVRLSIRADTWVDPYGCFISK